MQRDTSETIPVIAIWGRLLVPLVGDLADGEVERLSYTLLDRFWTEPVEGLVIDASGVRVMDSELCAALGRLATAARLMGVPCVLCGLGHAVVVMLRSMELDFAGIRTTLGLEEALEELGLRVTVTAAHGVV